MDKTKRYSLSKPVTHCVACDIGCGVFRAVIESSTDIKIKIAAKITTCSTKSVGRYSELWIYTLSVRTLEIKKSSNNCDCYCVVSLMYRCVIRDL